MVLLMVLGSSLFRALSCAPMARRMDIIGFIEQYNTLTSTSDPQPQRPTVFQESQVLSHDGIPLRFHESLSVQHKGWEVQGTLDHPVHHPNARFA